MKKKNPSRLILMIMIAVILLLSFAGRLRNQTNITREELAVWSSYISNCDLAYQKINALEKKTNAMREIIIIQDEEIGTVKIQRNLSIVVVVIVTILAIIF